MNKLSSLHEAVASIQPGAHVALPGFAIARCAMAFTHEVIRQGINHLTLSQCVGAMDADILVGAGMADRLIYGGGSLDRFGRLSAVNRGIETGTLAAEEYSSLSVTFRYLAGSLGLPFIPICSLQGSDLLANLKEHHPDDVATIQDPFTGDDWLALKPSCRTSPSQSFPPQTRRATRKLTARAGITSNKPGQASVLSCWRRKSSPPKKSANTPTAT